MNKEWVLFHLKEAMEELAVTIREIESEPEYDFPEFSVAMNHLYHHVNTAWNSRSSSDEAVNLCSESDCIKWRQFPIDIDMT